MSRLPAETNCVKYNSTEMKIFLWRTLISLCSDRSPFARNGLETRFDAGHGTSRSTGLALKEVKTRVLLKKRVGRSTRVASYILFSNCNTTKNLPEGF